MEELIYLDNAATTKPKVFRNDYNIFWMNSNSPYTKNEEQKELEKAKNKIKNCLNLNTGYVLFFRCATEAIEWLAHNFCVSEVYCSPYEHDSVFNVSDRIMENETQIFFNHEEYGLYCHQLVNQITGDTWDIKKAKEEFVTKPNQFFGVDLTAAIGHVILPNNLEEYCDALWFSGHKFYTEKNMGCMWISNRLAEYLCATKDPRNQYGLLHGTIDTQGVMMIANALEYVQNTICYTYNPYHEFISRLITDLWIRKIDANLITVSKNKTYAINAIHFPGINADALQTYLASKDIYIGVAHSACTDNADYRVLENMGISKEVAKDTVRISFSIDNTLHDIICLIEEIKNFKERF